MMVRNVGGLMVSMVLAACGAPEAGDSSGSSSEAGEASETGEASGSTGAAADPYACVETMRQEFGPLAGPGWDPVSGPLDPKQATYVVHSTQILVKPDQVERFSQLLDPVMAQLQSSEGLVAYTAAQDMNCGWSRTLGIWRSEEAIYKFMASGAHLAAMSETTTISFTGKVTHWTVPADQLPVTWADAEAQLAMVAPSGFYE